MAKTKSHKKKSELINAKGIQQFEVYKNSVYVGNLVRTHKGCELQYDKDFCKQHLHTSITYHTPVQSAPLVFDGVNLPPYFAGLLPEGLRLKALTRKIKTSTDDLFSLLVSAGNDPVGDIHFSNTGEFLDNILTDFKKIKSDIQKAIPLDSKPLAGVQDKISADRITLPLTIKKQNKSYILKLAADEFPEIIQNEHISLQIAKACGLNVNKTKIIYDSHGVEALLVERFDREWDIKDKAWKRYHQEDACQFLNKYPADKYNISFQEIAEGIKKFAFSPEIEILKMMELKAFSYLIGNGDLHAKNISLLNDQLSPCYDIVCTALYGDDKMALMLDGKNQNLKRKNFTTFGMRYGVPADLTDTMLDRLLIKFQKNVDSIFLLEIAQQKDKFLKTFFQQRLKHLA